MSRDYRVTGINLKRQPLGEADLLVTLFTREQGVLRAIAKGAKGAKSSWGARLDLFVVHDVQVAPARSLDRMVQSQVLYSFHSLSRDLSRLSTAQYWAESILGEAVSGQAHPELFDTFLEHLGRLEHCPHEAVAAHLVHGIYQLLLINGTAPQVTSCTVTGREIRAEAAGFSPTLGGVVCQEALGTMGPTYTLTTAEVNAFQWLAQPELPEDLLDLPVWINLEPLLRKHLELHLERPIRSASLLDMCFTPP